MILALTLAAAAQSQPVPPERPDVLVIVADDQGCGDLGRNGNPVLRTPRLDRLAEESLRCTRFYVHPVCAPTRTTLMTGRYPFRTGAINTQDGHARMHADEVTLAEALRSAGYRTALVGKWHLGNTWPLRPQDQGFETALWHRGGGLTKAADPPPGSSYFDPLLFRGDELFRAKGYVTDVLADEAIRILREPRDRPLFLYLAFNAPHTPLMAPEEDLALYRDEDLSPGRFPSDGRPVDAASDPERVARVYAMITNLDRNVGRILDALDETGRSADTLVIYLSDNGPQDRRFDCGLRGGKGRVYEGGIRVPFFARWPGVLEPRDLDGVAAGIDLFPTVLAACGVDPPAGVVLDGENLWPWWTGARERAPDRRLFIQWHAGDRPVQGRSVAVIEGRWKLVQPLGAGAREGQRFELYDISEDPSELHDLAGRERARVTAMRRAYAAWFHAVTADGRWASPPVVLGHPSANPVQLTLQDRCGEHEPIGYWDVTVERAGTYELTTRFRRFTSEATARVAVGAVSAEQEVPAGATRATFTLELPAGRAHLVASQAAGSDLRGARYVDVKALD